MYNPTRVPIPLEHLDVNAYYSYLEISEEILDWLKSNAPRHDIDVPTAEERIQILIDDRYDFFQSFHDEFLQVYPVIVFRNEDDAIMFKMRWG